jgi:hypothetical protein
VSFHTRSSGRFRLSRIEEAFGVSRNCTLSTICPSKRHKATSSIVQPLVRCFCTVEIFDRRHHHSTEPVPVPRRYLYWESRINFQLQYPGFFCLSSSHDEQNIFLVSRTYPVDTSIRLVMSVEIPYQLNSSPVTPLCHWGEGRRVEYNQLNAD